MALKLILEPIFEAHFVATGYGFRPGRRAHDAIAEVYHSAQEPSNSTFVVEGDIEACFRSHRPRQPLGPHPKRLGDRKILALLKAFVRAGVLSGAGTAVRNVRGTPQGGIISPLWPITPSTKKRP